MKNFIDCNLKTVKTTYITDKILPFITRKVAGKELLQEMGEFDWLRKHVLQIDNAR